MTAAEKRSAVRRKRSKAQGVGGKPTNVRTFTKRKTEKLPEEKAGRYGKRRSKRNTYRS